MIIKLTTWLKKKTDKANNLIKKKKNRVWSTTTITYLFCQNDKLASKSNWRWLTNLDMKFKISYSNNHTEIQEPLGKTWLWLLIFIVKMQYKNQMSHEHAKQIDMRLERGCN